MPAGLVWPGKLPGGDVEIIQHGHRYAVVWPSRHPSGRLYVWWDPEDYSDTPAQWVPKIKELEELPAAWVAGLTQGKTASRRPGVVVNDRMRDHGPDARQWLTPGEPCQAVIRVLDHFGPASRHDTMVQAQVRLLRLGEQGHRGVRAALDTLESMFVEAVTADGSRDPALAEDEWRRALNDAPAVIVAQGLTHPMRRGCCMEVPRLLTGDEQHERFAYGRIEDFARLLDGEGADDV